MPRIAQTRQTNSVGGQMKGRGAGPRHAGDDKQINKTNLRLEGRLFALGRGGREGEKSKHANKGKVRPADDIFHYHWSEAEWCVGATTPGARGAVRPLLMAWR